jgi:hypothetical protein
MKTTGLPEKWNLQEVESGLGSGNKPGARAFSKGFFDIFSF